ncbi:MAG: hypothetical protein V7L02_14200 [Nostoc sp.]|uniref:DUF7689 domain-containing protein n=1 Tax=unclassified Nostoc TaxID=2593658 RepID=UPI001E102BDD|nr:hypothetical protein [Nostoc sp. JL34]MBN3887378.1 hypothetical protein [Nostoc sp. JL34]
MDIDGKLESYRENKFPNFYHTEYSVISKQSTSYNCFAWAAGEDNRWWSPIDPDNMYYWVEGFIANFVKESEAISDYTSKISNLELQIDNYKKDIQDLTSENQELQKIAKP